MVYYLYRRVVVLLGNALLLSALLSVPEIHAEVTKHDSDVIKQETSASMSAEKAAERAREREITEDNPNVTFEMILADPDNIELNFLYAKTLVAENNLLGAAATLERILMVDPDLAQIRLFYAIVLYRLDNLVESQRELEALLALEMPDSLRDEVKEYIQLIKIRRKNTIFGLRQSVGYQFDTNRNAAPSSKRRLAFDLPLGITGTDRKRRDTSFLNVTNFDVTHDLGTQAGHEVFGSFTYYMQEQTMVDNLDLQSFQYSFGGVYKSSWFHFTPSFYASHVTLSRETYLRTQGGEFLIDRNLSPTLNVYSSTRIERQDFSGISETTTGRERKGPLFQTEIGYSHRFTPTMTLSNSIGYTNKNAEEEFNAYEQLTLRTSHTWLLGRGQFLINSAEFTFDFYDEPETTIASRIRRDKSVRYRVTYGAPLESLFIGRLLPKIFRDVTLTLTYEYYRSLSTITNYTYRNNKFQGLLTKKWTF